MSYTIYHTPGIVIGISNRGEANREFRILTRDLGLVRAKAQGVRKDASKLRYGLQHFSHSHFDFVYGKSSWQIVGSEPIATPTRLLADAHMWRMWNKIAKLLDRLIPYDERHPLVYESIFEGYTFSQKEHLEIQEIRIFEQLLVMRVLSALGYWDSEDTTDSLLESPFSKELFSSLNILTGNIVRKINASLKASHL